MRVNCINNVFFSKSEKKEPKKFFRFDFKPAKDVFIKTTDKIKNFQPKPMHFEDKTQTDVEFCSLRSLDTTRAFSPFILELCKKHGVNPKEDLFIVSGLDVDNNRYVLFNTFFHDDETGGEFEMLAYLISDCDDELSDTQLAAYRVFYDMNNLPKMAKFSQNNPLKTAIDNRESAEVNSLIRIWAKNSNEIDEDKLFNESGEVEPVIYSANADNIKNYKIGVSK